MLLKSLVLIATSGLTAVLAIPSPSSSLSSRQSPGWTIHALTFACTPTPSSCLYTFSIDTNDGVTPASCSINNTVADAPHASWYDRTCSPNQTSWHVSWGYNGAANPAFAVVTVVNTTSSTRAFFGYANVGGGSGSYGDNGPQTVSQG